MKKIKDFIYNNKKYILLFILLILFNICMASCHLPKAKAVAELTDLNQLFGKTWLINDTLTLADNEWASSASVFEGELYAQAEDKTQPIICYLGDKPVYSAGTDKLFGTFYINFFAHKFEAEGDIWVHRWYANFNKSLGSHNSIVSDENLVATYSINGTTWVDESYKNLRFNEQIYPFYLNTLQSNIDSWNPYITEIPPTPTNNLNIYVNDILAYNDIIEFNNTGNPGIQFIYSNYTTNQFDFINNLAKPLKYTANEFIANVFNVSNETTTASSIDFAFTGSYLVGVSYDYINTAGNRVSNSYELSPDDDDSIRFLMFTDLQRNDTDINVRITTNNLNDFESGAVNSAFKTLFGFFNEIINIQFGFITIGQILGFILAIAIIGLIYKVWNGGNND